MEFAENGNVTAVQQRLNGGDSGNRVEEGRFFVQRTSTWECGLADTWRLFLYPVVRADGFSTRSESEASGSANSTRSSGT